MKIHPLLSLVPAAGAVGATVMSYNAGLDIAKQQGIANTNAYSINTSDMNFLGAQDALISGSLFIGFAALARGIYLYATDQKGDARKYFALAGGMLMATGLYALTAGFFNLGIPGSKIGDFGLNPILNKSIFGIVYSGLTIIGGALLGTGYKMTTSNAKSVIVSQDDGEHSVGTPTLTASSDPKIAGTHGVQHVVHVYGTNSNNNNNTENVNHAKQDGTTDQSLFSRLWSSVSNASNRTSNSKSQQSNSKPQQGKK